MIDERKMLLELISYQKRLVQDGNIEECVTIADIIRWIAEQPQVTKSNRRENTCRNEKI